MGGGGGRSSLSSNHGDLAWLGKTGVAETRERTSQSHSLCLSHGKKNKNKIVMLTSRLLECQLDTYQSNLRAFILEDSNSIKNLNIAKNLSKHLTAASPFS